MTAIKNKNLKTKARNERSWQRAQARHRANAAANELLHVEKVLNNGLGAREMRRIESGIRNKPDDAELLYILKRPTRGKRRKFAVANRATEAEAELQKKLAEATKAKTIKKDRKKK